MTSEGNIRAVFKRIERDDEFRARLLAAGFEPGTATGLALDWFGEAHGKPRRVVEDVS